MYKIQDVKEYVATMVKLSGGKCLVSEVYKHQVTISEKKPTKAYEVLQRTESISLCSDYVEIFR